MSIGVARRVKAAKKAAAELLIAAEDLAGDFETKCYHYIPEDLAKIQESLNHIKDLMGHCKSK